ncbi:MAG: amidohydrolase [Salibacteraceae bacterium]|jgi:amidohydrolase
MLNEVLLNKLRHIRKTLHAHPEVSEHEFKTQERILKFLGEESNGSARKIGNTGVLATFENDQPGPTIMIRGDIDALPITEVNTFAHTSKNPGISHKCGHDGHTTILLGLASLLTDQPITKGKVLLLFQPAEENGMGAEAVLRDVSFNAQNIDFVFALHNLPGYPTHEIVVKENEFTGNVKSIILKMTGKTAHAAEPEQGYNPSLAISEILVFAEKITHNKPAEPNFFLMTPIHATLGETAYGISAGYGEVHFTIRSWDTDLMAERSNEIVAFFHATCKKHHLQADISWTQVFHANINSPEAVTYIREAANHNQYNLTERAYPFRWGEDFGLFTQKYKGAMFGIGSGVSTPALHNPDYDYPDEITPTGVQMFYQIIQKIL